MDALLDKLNLEVWFMKAGQLGWTEILLNVVGYFVHLDPCPIMVVQPTVDMADAWSKDRLDPMLRDTPALRGRVKEVRGRGADRGNTIRHKKFKRGHLTIIGANSTAGLRQRPIRVLLFDEVDDYPRSAGKGEREQGDPITLSKKRTTAFWNRRVLGGSTPTTGGSRISKAFESGDQRRYFVSCPHCESSYYFKWEHVTWRDDDSMTARLACPHCGVLITDSERIEMIRKGEWRATAPFHGIASFHIWEAYNTMVTLEKMVRDYLEQSKTPEGYRAFVNSTLGEPYDEPGEAPDLDRVLSLREGYSQGEVPADVYRVSCGVDVQQNRLVYAVRGWGLNLESWLIRHDELWGDTEQPFVWDQLQMVLDANYGDGHIALMGVDSGYRPDQVYRFCRRNQSNTMATKGHDTAQRYLWSSRIDVMVNGKQIKHGLQLWHLHTDYFKSFVHGRLEWEGESGRFHLPSDASDDYCKQLVAESRHVDDETGKVTWRVDHKDNHYLDCEVINAAVAHRLQMHVMRKPSVQSVAPTPRSPQRNWIKQW